MNNFCKDCTRTFTNPLDAWSIKQGGRCAVCQKKWEGLPENDPENKKFYITYEMTETGTETIYAKNEAEAREQFGETFGDDYEIVSIDAA